MDNKSQEFGRHIISLLVDIKNLIINVSAFHKKEHNAPEEQQDKSEQAIEQANSGVNLPLATSYPRKSSYTSPHSP